MSIEIERKYLVKNNNWIPKTSHIIKQGYLNRDKDRVVRVRIFDNAGYITIKGKTKGIERSEFEYEIPLSDAEQLLNMCEKPILEKKRSIVIFDTKKWEIDQFQGENEGLVIAEIELENINEVINLPPWIGIEVSDDPKYYNSNLIYNPYSNWIIK